MKANPFICFMLSIFLWSCQGAGKSDLGSGKNSASKNPGSADLKSASLPSLLKERMSSSEIFKILGEPFIIEPFNGTGPGFEIPENMDPVIWRYKDYPGNESAKNELVIIMASSTGPHGRGDYLVKWIVTK